MLGTYYRDRDSTRLDPLLYNVYNVNPAHALPVSGAIKCFFLTIRD